jgi:hypothetical protein
VWQTPQPAIATTTSPGPATASKATRSSGVLAAFINQRWALMFIGESFPSSPVARSAGATQSSALFRLLLYSGTVMRLSAIIDATTCGYLDLDQTRGAAQTLH